MLQIGAIPYNCAANESGRRALILNNIPKRMHQQKIPISQMSDLNLQLFKKKKNVAKRKQILLVLYKVLPDVNLMGDGGR